MPNRTVQPIPPTDTAAHRTTPRPWPTLIVPLAPGDTAALTHLRALAQHALLSWNVADEHADEILVVLSELATNALIHTHGPTRIRLHRRADRIRLDVTDTSTEQADLSTGPTNGEHGYGLALIALALADEITCATHRHGKTMSAFFHHSRGK